MSIVANPTGVSRLSKEAHFKVWHREKAAPTLTQDVVQKIETPHTKESKKKKRARGVKRKLAQPKKSQRIRKRPKKVKEENEDEPMPEALPPMNDAELMDLVQSSRPNAEHSASSVPTGVDPPVANQPVPRTQE